jgi:hypothetical protein
MVSPTNELSKTAAVLALPQPRPKSWSKRERHWREPMTAAGGHHTRAQACTRLHAPLSVGKGGGSRSARERAC